MNDQAACSRSYYLTHRDAILARRREYRLSHPDQEKAYLTVYREQNKGRIKEKVAEYNSVHRETIRERQAARYIAHANERDEEYKAKHAACARKSYHLHPERALRYAKFYAHTPQGRLSKKRTDARRKALLRGGGHIDMRGFTEKCAELNWTCQLCGKQLSPQDVTMDHIVPISRGGTNDLYNLQPLCMSCNAKKGARTMEEAKVLL